MRLFYGWVTSFEDKGRQERRLLLGWVYARGYVYVCSKDTEECRKILFNGAPKAREVDA